MTGTSSSLLRSLLIYSICLPVAVYLGYLATEPLTYTTFAGFGFVLLFLMLPLLFRWHHLWLIAGWNFGAVLFFIPGRPDFWLAMVWLSLTLSVVQYILNRRLRFMSVPSVSRPLILIAVVVLVTAKVTGGFGVQALGSSVYGGKRYVLLLSAIAGYFAITAQQIPGRRALLYICLFFLGAITNAIGETAPHVSSAFYFVYLFFPVSTTVYTMINPESLGGGGMVARLGGVATACSGVFFAMLARYGVQGMFSLRRIGLLLLFGLVVAISMFGGFRSLIIMYILTFAAVFYLEGLMRTRLLPMMLLLLVFAAALLIPFVEHLPLPMQRSLTFLPLNVDPIARASADDTTEWRLGMWKRLLPEIPQHLIVGKGLGFNAADGEQARLAERAMGATATENSELVGDYHSGPLSIILPFGLPGVFAFSWFLISSFRVLNQNYKFGHPAYRRLNIFLFAFFIAKTVYFIGVFGSFYSDLMMFTGVIGLSVSLNGGVARPFVIPQPKARLQVFKMRPPVRRPVTVA